MSEQLNKALATAVSASYKNGIWGVPYSQWLQADKASDNTAVVLLGSFQRSMKVGQLIYGWDKIWEITEYNWVRQIVSVKYVRDSTDEDFK